MNHALQTIGWVVCGIYATIPAFWLIIHPFADFWRKRYRAPLKVLVFVWIALWIAAWVASAPWRYASLPLADTAQFIAIPFWCISLFIYFGGQRHFSFDQVIGRTELESDRHDQVLVTTGLHARMRHPLYFGHLCTMLGWLSVTRTTAVLGLLIFAVITGAAMIRAEDAELEQRFGDSYREYRSRVPAVIPRF
jgi:protein-S-isoprenylcysteine O-methyltransferase Ste14